MKASLCIPALLSSMLLFVCNCGAAEPQSGEKHVAFLDTLSNVLLGTDHAGSAHDSSALKGKGSKGMAAKPATGHFSLFAKSDSKGGLLHHAAGKGALKHSGGGGGGSFWASLALEVGAVVIENAVEKKIHEHQANAKGHSKDSAAK